MTSTFQLLHRRFGNARPGMQLLAVEDAAVPVTVVQTDVLAQERKPLPIIEEFLVRLVAAGVDDGTQIAGMLGIGTDQVLEATAIQVSENNLRKHVGRGGISLTAQGAEVARNLAATRPVIKQLPIVFDRLVWQMADYSRSTLLTKKEAQENGMLIIPASQNARIGLTDITADGFNALLNKQEGRERRVEILRVRKVSPNTHRYLPVQLLVYGDAARGDLELAVCIDDELQPNHGLALDATSAVQTLGLSVGPPTPRPILEDELERQRVGGAEVELLASAPVEESSHVESADSLSGLAVRSVSVFEHTALLGEALDRARRRLLIISPWVRSAVVTTDFLAKLERRLRSGVEVTIGHGYGDDDSGSDENALKKLSNLAGRYRKQFTLARLPNTHAKILIFDDQWVATSFNWLSFRGDPERTYRMEEGTLVQIASRVDEAYERYFQLASEHRL